MSLGRVGWWIIWWQDKRELSTLSSSRVQKRLNLYFQQDEELRSLCCVVNNWIHISTRSFYIDFFQTLARGYYAGRLAPQQQRNWPESCRLPSQLLSNCQSPLGSRGAHIEEAGGWASASTLTVRTAAAAISTGLCLDRPGCCRTLRPLTQMPHRFANPLTNFTPALMSDRSCPLQHRKPQSPSAVKDKNVCQFARFARLLATTPV